MSVSIINRFRIGPEMDAVASRLRKFKLTRPVRIMEVCGTHTVSIFRHGIRDMLPDGVELISGPGCPVCVTPGGFIDAAVKIAVENPQVLITTFGDMVRVPGSKGSLSDAGRDVMDRVRVVYSQLDVLKIAEEERDKKIVFLSVGFETTTPGTALMLKRALAMNLDNIFLLTANKLIPPAMRALLSSDDVKIDGFLLPAHVSTIIGLEPYGFLPCEFGVSGVVAGFEPLDIALGVLRLLELFESNTAAVENVYSRVARAEGNPSAQKIVEEVFAPVDTEWRGLGSIPLSGLELKEEYKKFDAVSCFGIEILNSSDPPGCRCGDVLCGRIKPLQCSLFGTACTPHSPVGPCMVSREGTCAAYYRYARRSEE